MFEKSADLKILIQKKCAFINSNLRKRLYLEKIQFIKFIVSEKNPVHI